MAIPADLPDVLQKYYTAFQKGDIDTLRSIYGDEATLRDPGIGFLLNVNDLTARGPEEIAAYFYRAFSNMPAPPQLGFLEHRQSEDVWFVEYTEGVMTYLDRFTIKDGRITEQKVYWGSIPPAPLVNRQR